MSRSKRNPRARTVRRRAGAASEKLVRAQSRLLDLEPGGSPARPLDVSTAAVIEPKARAIRCPRCDEPFTLEAHEVSHARGEPLREAKLVCRRCGLGRSAWFRITQPS